MTKVDRRAAMIGAASAIAFPAIADRRTDYREYTFLVSQAHGQGYPRKRPCVLAELSGVWPTRHEPLTRRPLRLHGHWRFGARSCRHVRRTFGNNGVGTRRQPKR